MLFNLINENGHLVLVIDNVVSLDHHQKCLAIDAALTQSLKSATLSILNGKTYKVIKKYAGARHFKIARDVLRKFSVRVK